MKRLLLLASCLCLFGTGLIGCQNTEEGMKQDADKNGQAVQNATDNAADKTKNAMDKAGDKMQPAVDNTKGAMENAGDNLNLKPKLAVAYGNDAKLKDTDIHTDIKDGKVYLKGSVKTNDQKKLATELTEKTIKEANSKDTVVNQLTVTSH